MAKINYKRQLNRKISKGYEQIIHKEEDTIRRIELRRNPKTL